MFLGLGGTLTGVGVGQRLVLSDSKLGARCSVDGSGLGSVRGALSVSCSDESSLVDGSGFSFRSNFGVASLESVSFKAESSLNSGFLSAVSCWVPVEGSVGFVEGSVGFLEGSVGFLEGFGGVVRFHDGDTAGSAVGERGGHGRRQVRLGDHVFDGVVDEDRVEGTAEPHRSHVALFVSALRVETLRQLQHVSGEVDQGHIEVGLEVRRAVAAAAAQLKYFTYRNCGRLDHTGGEGRLLGVSLGWGDERPPWRKVAIHPIGGRFFAHRRDPSM